MLSAAPGSNVQLGAILLAAGSSSRLGRAKQLLEIEGEPLVARQAKCLVQLQPATVIVVTGAEHEGVSAALENLPVTLVHNPDWAQGMGSSLACGIRAMPERVRAALVVLCDQWKLEIGDLESLVSAWEADPKAAVVAQYSGTTGPPAILPRALFDQLSRLRGDTGAKRILKRWNGSVDMLAMQNAAPDIDVSQDLPGTS